MTDFIDEKYIKILSPQLPLFKQKAQHTYNFRCVLCGDSKKDPLKCRGFLYEKKGDYHFYCHNCNASMSFPRLLKTISPFLYREYTLEKFGQKESDYTDTRIKEFYTDTRIKLNLRKKIDLPSIDSLSDNHIAKKYVKNRKIPQSKWEDLYYTDSFRDFVNDLIPDNNKPLYNESRLVIPFYDPKGHLLGIQGRAINDSKVRYICIKTHESNSKVFGWDKVNTSKKIYVCEGPIDSMFLENSVASMDADLTRVVPIIGIDKDYVFIYDNEKRNPQIINKIKETIERGYKVCIWPSNIEQKDINEMVLAGTHPSFIQHLIDQNTYEGLQATLQLTQWSKL